MDMTLTKEIIIEVSLDCLGHPGLASKPRL